MTVNLGEPAPDFELFGEFDRETRAYRAYHLADELKDHPMVLHFFPAPFTRVCQAQMCDVRDHAQDVYGARGVGVWGVTGHYPWLIERWEREHHFGVPILADYEHVARRSRYVEDDDDGRVFRAGRDRGIWFYRNLFNYLQYYSRDAYEDFEGEDTFDLDAVDILTVHQAKGLEWPVVFVPCLTDKRFPSGKAGQGQDCQGGA